MRDYREWLEAMATLEQAAARITPEDLVAPEWPPVAEDAPVALLCSPHPDDEVITGALPLRLRREGWRVVNLAITLGSAVERRRARLTELTACCDFLGFELCVAGEEAGLERIRPDTRKEDATTWGVAVLAVATQLQRWKPRVVFMPHAADHHPTHIGVHLLALDALRACNRIDRTWLVETEFWGAHPRPNLMVTSTQEDLAILLGGLRQHVGEVARNPYHLRLPAWMSDNVRRGSELIGGAGAVSVDSRFATLYCLGLAGKAESPRVLRENEAASALFSITVA